MSNDLISISAKEISSAVKEAIARNDRLKGDSDEIAINPVIIIGKMIAKTPDTSLKALQDQAAELAKSLPASFDSKPAVIVYDEQVIVGFTQTPITVLKE